MGVRELGTDPTERPRQWLGFAFLVGLALIILPVFAWEMVAQHGRDYEVMTGCFTGALLILVGPVGIRIVRRDQNGGSIGNVEDNGSGPL